MICDDCEKEKDNVETVNCPYVGEVYDEAVEVKLCDGCYQERCWEV